MVLFIFVRGEGKCEIEYSKAENFFFSFRELLTIFGAKFAGKDD